MKKILIALLIGLSANLFAAQMDFVIRTVDTEFRFDCEDVEKIRNVRYYDDKVYVVFDTDELAEIVSANTGYKREGKTVIFTNVVFADYIPDAHD